MRKKLATLTFMTPSKASLLDKVGLMQSGRHKVLHVLYFGSQPYEKSVGD